jgi:hypothetical protein
MVVVERIQDDTPPPPRATHWSGSIESDIALQPPKFSDSASKKAQKRLEKGLRKVTKKKGEMWSQHRHRLFVFLFSVRAMAQSRPTLAPFCLAAIIDTTQPTIELRDCSVQLDTTTTSSSTLQAWCQGLCAAGCGLSYRARIGFLRWC